MRDEEVKITVQYIPYQGPSARCGSSLYGNILHCATYIRTKIIAAKTIRSKGPIAKF